MSVPESRLARLRLRPWRVTAGLALALLLPATAAGADAGTTYTFTRVMDVPSTWNEQGLAYANGLFYVGFDRGGGKGQVVGYDESGAVRVDSGPLTLGHAAELSFRRAAGNLYVASGGATNASWVRALDLRRTPPSVVRTYDFRSLGNNAMVAVDNARDRMLVFTGRDTQGRWVFTWSDFEGRTTPGFTLVAKGVPQGLEVVRDQVLYLTSAADRSSNTLRVLSLTGRLAYEIPVPVALESEGLATELETNRVYVGYHSPDRIDRMAPVLSAPVGINLLANPGAESGTGATTQDSVQPVPGWTATGMTVLTYGARSGYPSATSPGPSSRGALFFAGGNGSTGRLLKDLPLAGLPAADVDASRMRYTLSGWLGGYLQQEDSARVEVTFRGSGGVALGSSQIGPVTAADRGGITGLLQRARSGVVPPGTRALSVSVEATRVFGSHLDAYVDELSLVLTRA